MYLVIYFTIFFTIRQYLYCAFFNTSLLIKIFKKYVQIQIYNV